MHIVLISFPNKLCNHLLVNYRCINEIKTFIHSFNKLYSLFETNQELAISIETKLLNSFELVRCRSLHEVL